MLWLLKFNKLPMSGTINKHHLNKHTFSHKYNNHHNIQGVKSMCINIRRYLQYILTCVLISIKSAVFGDSNLQLYM